MLGRHLTTLEVLLGCFFLLTSPGIIREHNVNGEQKEAVIINVKEGSDVILPCSLSTKENIEKKLFDWKKEDQKEVFLFDAGIHYNNGRIGQDQQFKSRVSHFQDELKYGNASIMIRNTKVTDSGNYTCVFPRLQPESQIFHIQLVVGHVLKDRSCEYIPGAASRPSIKILNQTTDVALLQCEVQGASPKPEVEWQDSAGNKFHAEEPQISERGGHYNITLQTSVNKTDLYHCVATQMEISHQTDAEIYVLIIEPPTVRVVAAVLLTFLVIGIVLVLLVVMGCITINSKRCKLPADPHPESVPINDPNPKGHVAGGGDGAMDKTHAFGVRDPGSNPL